MIITGMAHFESVCKKKLVDWYHKNKPGVEIDLSNVFVVWACKTLQNYKCLASTTISGDGIYAEYTYTVSYTHLDVYKRQFLLRTRKRLRRRRKRSLLHLPLRRSVRKRRRK